MNLVNKVGVLSIEGSNVTYDNMLDIPSAFNPYNIDMTPDGRFAVASHTGAQGINADAEVSIAAAGAHPHVAEITAPGTGAEGFTIAPNGKWAVTPLIEGSGAKPTAWNYTKGGHAVLMSVGTGGRLAVVDKAPIGALPEGIAFSRNSNYVYIGNFIDKNLQIFRIAAAKLIASGTMALPGQPASMRGPAR